MSGRFSMRLETLQKKLETYDLGVLQVSHMKNIEYLTGFTGTTGVLLLESQEASLWVDGRYVSQAGVEASGVDVRATERDVLRGLWVHLRSRRITNCGIEANHLSYSDFLRMKEAMPDAKISPVWEVVENQRAVKEVSEIEALREASRIADEAYQEFVEWLEPGMIERDVAARLDHSQRVNGGGRKPSETIVSSGNRTALPHGIASDRVIQTGEPVMIDIGAVVRGYTSDMSRTVHLGAPNAEFRRVYEIVQDAQRIAEEGLRPGMSGKEIDSLARQHIAASGYEDFFPHSLGHSVGLEIHEKPLFGPMESTVIEAGMVITVEPGIYLPGRFGVRIEDTVLVTEHGGERLTTCCRDLVIR